ncbi:hypothetical protein ACRRTK_008220 [Alexandromys fortis]
MANGGTRLECESAIHPHRENYPSGGMTVVECARKGTFCGIWSFRAFKEKMLRWKENMEVTACVTLYGPHKEAMYGLTYMRIGMS